MVVGCESWRQELSARLDGEDDLASRVAVDAHLARCAGCRQWMRDAAAVTQAVRADVPAPESDLTEAVLAATAGRRGHARVEAVLRVLLAAFGLAQLVLGIVQAAAGGDPGAEPIRQDTSLGHLWHESAAWNIAVGAGFAWVGLRRSRPAGMVPTLTAFVAALALLSIDDLVAGRVQPARLLGHGFLIAGYVVVLLLSGLSAGSDALRAPSGRSLARRRSGRSGGDQQLPPAPPRLRVVRGGEDTRYRGAA